MKKNRKHTKPTYWGMDATTTNKDWGFSPVPGKGGKTTNFGSGLGERQITDNRKDGNVNA